MTVVERPTVENRLARAGLFVRAHLDERITLDAVAEVAGFSAFHFHRVFRVAFGENLNAFVTRHRLQRAARDLRTTRLPVIEIGMRCGYESPSAFGRAFSRAFAMTPSAYRAAGGDAPVLPSALVPSAADVPEPRVERCEERPVLALRHVGPYDELDAVMVRAYRIARRRGFFPEARMFGLSYDSPDLEAHASLRADACFTYVPGADVTGARADGMRDIVIPGGTYAVFRHVGPYERITNAYDRLVAAWVLTGRVELRAAPFINTYLSDPATVAAGALECDLAIPIL
jgi:AraC family transcriptional regulator